MAKPKTNTKAKKAAQEPTDDQKKSGAVAQTGAGETPAPALDTTPVTSEPAQTGADKNAAPVKKETPLETKGEADPSEVAKAVTSEADESAAPRKLTPDENAELSRQIKATPEELQNRRGPKELLITVVGPAKGFRRAGRRFGKEPTTFSAEEITAEQLVALEATPELLVSFSQDPVAPSAD